MADTPKERHESRGFVPGLQPKDPRVGQLLWEILQVGTVPGLQPPEPEAGALGAEEIQAVSSPTPSHALASGDRPKRTGAVCSLAAGGDTVNG